MALLYPPQGHWSETEYLAVTTNRLIEFSDGFLEFLPMPLPFHQLIVRMLFRLLDAFVTTNALGEAFFAPLRVHLWSGKYREPDIVFVRRERIRELLKPTEGADLAMEVVSGDADDRLRDLVTKRTEYAQAGIAEYWIVDPEEQRITVLTLDGDSYREHGVFRPGERATSVLLPGFGVDVMAVFAAGQPNG
jgi:Uma2 family endonuclease